MRPLITPQTKLWLVPCRAEELAIGDILVYRGDGGWIIHRLWGRTPRGRLLCKGDWRLRLDPPVEPEQVVGRLLKVSGGFWPAPLWRALNVVLIYGVTRPAGLLLHRPRHFSSRRLLQRFQGALLSLDRGWRRLRVLRGVQALPQGWFVGPRGGGLKLEEGALVDYRGVAADWPAALEAVKQHLAGWGPGHLLSPGPQRPGWEVEHHQAWLDFLVSEGFVVRGAGPGCRLELHY